MDFAPFYVGQRVVAVDDLAGITKGKSRIVAHKGDEFTIKAIIKCCDHWLVDVGITDAGGSQCECGTRLSASAWYAYSKCFVSIDEKFESITLSEIIEKESELITNN